MNTDKCLLQLIGQRWTVELSRKVIQKQMITTEFEEVL